MAAPVARVIAQQYSSTTLVSVRFHSRKDYFSARLKNIIPLFFSLLNLRKSEIASLETATVWNVCSMSVSSSRLVPPGGLQAACLEQLWKQNRGLMTSPLT
jgi:hypothetical protein